jgi:hypothetical protein
VHEKFGTRYSGHLLSRLAGFFAQPDQTDKVSYYMKGKRKEQFKASESMIHMRRLVEYDDYLYNFEVDRKRWLLLPLSSRLQTWVGRLVDLGPSHGYACLSGNTDLEWVLTGRFLGVLCSLGLSK